MEKDTKGRIDEHCFKEAYDQYWYDLLVMAKRFLTDEEIAKGLVQQVFISLWERRQSVVIHSCLRNYLYRALKLKIMEHYRNQQVRERHKAHILQVAETHGTCTDEYLRYKELIAAVNAAIAQLPDRCRQVYLMSRNDGLPNKLIAAELLITEKAVEGNMTRALSYLKSKLNSYR